MTPLVHFIWDAGRDHLWAALAATGNLVVAAVVAVPAVFGAEVPDAALVGGLLFVLSTFTAIAGWALVLVVRLSSEVAKNTTQLEDHERRLSSGGI